MFIASSLSRDRDSDGIKTAVLTEYFAQTFIVYLFEGDNLLNIKF